MVFLVSARRLRAFLLALIPLLLLLASCGGGGAGTNGPDATLFTPERAFGGPPPNEAERVDPSTFEVIAGSDGFRWEGDMLRAQREVAAAAQYAADLDVLAVVTELAQRWRDLGGSWLAREERHDQRTSTC